MTSPNGYDAPGEDASLRRELQQLCEIQARSDARITDTTAAHWSLMDRVALSLGRLDAVERHAVRIEKLTEAIAAHLGVL